MNVFKKVVRQSWVFVLAVGLVVGSTSAMAYAMGSGIPQNTAFDVPVTISTVAEAQANTAASQEAQLSPGYTVDDRSGEVVKFKNDIMKKLNLNPDMTPEKAEMEYNKIVANATPGSQDLTPAQAAACAAQILIKIYDLDLTGYVAQTSFYRNPLPESGIWTVIFHASNAPELTENYDNRAYLASIDSETGIIQSASSFERDNVAGPVKKSLDDQSWLAKAEDYTKKLMQNGVTITGSRAVMKLADNGVSVVCSLSDGSAFGIRLVGDSQVAAAIIFYPNGYDGSLDKQPGPITGGVG